ncbi:MAG: hypothetical protein JG763_2429 [Shewanella sp.]|jgi:hypothetical protein|nr:hypothetical protein [Shewanella sp.]HCD14941.1 hypothetical protein [Shewanella sp.]
MLSLQEAEVSALTAEQNINCLGDKVLTWFVVTLVTVNKSDELLLSLKLGKKRPKTIPIVLGLGEWLMVEPCANVEIRQDWLSLNKY